MVFKMAAKTIFFENLQAIISAKEKKGNVLKGSIGNISIF